MCSSDSQIFALWVVLDPDLGQTMAPRPDAYAKALALILTGAAIHSLLSRDKQGSCYTPPADAAEGSAA
jgi:hypothetical protein